MFKIADGREHFYQWDINRQIVVEDSTIQEVHFCNKTDDCSLVVDVHDTLADVPNILLQNDFPIRVYAYCNDGYTKIEKIFKVNARTKPSDYVYTETEIKTVETVEKRMDDLEASLSTNISNAVADYMEEHPIDVDLSEYVKNTDYATTSKAGVVKASTNLGTFMDKSGVIGIAQATETNIDGRSSQTKPITPYNLDYAVKAGLSNNALEWTDEEKANAREVIGAIQKPEKDAGGYMRVPTIDPNGADSHLRIYATPLAYAIPQYATGGYLQTNTPTQELHAANKAYVDDAISNIDIPSLDGYATEKYVDDKVAEVSGGDVDLSNYYTKEEIDTTISRINECDTYFFNPNDYEFDIPRQPAIATEHIVEFAERFLAGDSINLMIFDVDKNRWIPAEFLQSGNEIIFTRLVTVTDIGGDNSFQQYKLYYVDDELRVYKYINPIYSLASKEYVDDAIANIEIPEGGTTDLSNYYTKDETYSKTEVDALIPSLDAYATKTYVDEAIADIDVGGGGSSSGGGANTFYLDFSAATSSTKLIATDEMKAFYNAYINGDNPIAYIKTYWSGSYYRPAIVKQLSNDSSLSLQYQPASFELYNCLVDNNTVTYDEISLSATTYSSNGWTQYSLQQSSGNGGSDWTITDELYGDNIYNAKEIFIRMQINDSGKWVFSHFICNPVFDETIGNSYNMSNIAFTTPAGMDNQTPYWSFDGYNLNINCEGSYSNVLVAYKH